MSTTDQTTNIYLCGDIEFLFSNYDWIRTKSLMNPASIRIVKEFSFSRTNRKLEQSSILANVGHIFVSVGQVPINVNNVGVYIRHAFDFKDPFDQISKAHEFQHLTESTKPGIARRTGIYITKVNNFVKNSITGLSYKLLRCSSNFKGATDDIAPIDEKIIAQTNVYGKEFFETPTDMNHVLAQIYHNQTEMKEGSTEAVERKAVISSHSDKTKDMPTEGLMAFCTFYENFDNDGFTNSQVLGVRRSPFDYFDWFHRNTSAMTILRFVLKNDVNDDSLDKEFKVVLYPNSVFIMSLTANRLYTHEIVPSNLSIKNMPLRMGYVIRCSKTTAVYGNDDKAYIIVQDQKLGEKLVDFEQPTPDKVQTLRNLYSKENKSSEFIDYVDENGNPFVFSMNNGDYQKPTKKD